MTAENRGFFTESLRDVYFRKRAEELALLLDDQTGGIRSELSAPVQQCLVCDSVRRRQVFRKDGFEFQQCLECGFIYADPQIEEDKLKGFYEKSSYDAFVDVLLSDANRAYDRKKYSHGLDIIEHHVARGRLLDVGCSVGYFPALAMERGWEVTGLELNQRAVEHARNVLGVSVEQKLLKDIEDRTGYYRVVTLWGVIEHLRRPKDEIRRTYRLLEPGGALLVFCPNVESLVCRVLRERAATFDGQVHCGYFSPTTLHRLLEDTGYRVVHTEAAQADVRSLLNHLNFCDPYGATVSAGMDLSASLPAGFAETLERYVLKHDLGYKMMMVAVKES